MKEIILAIIGLVIGAGIIYKIAITIRYKNNKHSSKQINKSSNWFSFGNTTNQSNKNDE
ncbi:hypothetical protein [Francisella philomiragia]|uniref:Uncharacterized protein n=1 Tax=Francisella philomiragia TaxID=28110 RepID=A0A0B6CW69_9GAMM|nr:hypothetical protein [Francisella philomiragia]AJI53080.1 hypothetical protein LA55_1607 [Francisella philomiragia]MBY7734802.1 hypothetical protein [Francisella philomiragia]